MDDEWPPEIPFCADVNQKLDDAMLHPIPATWTRPVPVLPLPMDTVRDCFPEAEEAKAVQKRGGDDGCSSSRKKKAQRRPTLPSRDHSERAACREISKAKEDKGNVDRDSLTSSILAKWNDQGSFIRFLDGNTLNCHITNLTPVSLGDAMQHVDGEDVWKVDWDMNLTPNEIALVRSPEWRAGLYFE